MKELARFQCLGIDESNHGKFPEIFVAVYSEFPNDVVALYGLPKKRKNKRDLSEILEGREFKYILMPKDYKEWFGENEIRIIAYYELIKNFGHLDKIIIDGELRKKEFDELSKLLKVENPMKIIAESRADTTYSVVNIADQIANVLFQYYNRFKNTRINTKFLQYLLTPKMEEHITLLENLEKKLKNS
ncbi:MAG: hypothetical protein QXG00_06390 [Candidatus Woesearchaeota archaeon]